MAVAATTTSADPAQHCLSASQSEAIGRVCEMHGIVLCYLFGSRADGYADARSDWDFGIVFGQQDGRPADTSRWLGVATDFDEALAPEKVDLVLLERATPFLRWEAIRGRLVYVASDLVRADYEEGVMRIWMDLKPFIEAQLRDQGNAIASGHFLG